MLKLFRRLRFVIPPVLVVILLASSALGLRSISEMFGTMLNMIPTLIAAVVIVILGMIVGEFIRGMLLASAGSVEGVPTLARLAKAAVVLISVFMAMQQLGVAAEIITASFTLILGAVALAAGLAFGLGNRDLAGEITRRWYEESQERRRLTKQLREERELASTSAELPLVRPPSTPPAEPVEVHGP